MLSIVFSHKRYDSDDRIENAESQGIIALISPRKNKKAHRVYDKYSVENAFLNLKLWRIIEGRYKKNCWSLLALVQIRCIALWTFIL
ncbi:hypothetical protein HCUR_00014 [Holospora curviuscula]|uniref:Transposase DDE domain-containing protein n=1 Tax=Holospora curviuscula TaxID=1082868 RepID=A0A2S5RI01_9PROT|nr:hypothetical protein HCUR_00014 [Holospora curviuscula]